MKEGKQWSSMTGASCRMVSIETEVCAKCLFARYIMVASCTINFRSLRVGEIDEVHPHTVLQNPSYSVHTDIAIRPFCKLNWRFTKAHTLNMNVSLTQHSSTSSPSEQYSFFLITRKPVLSFRACLTVGVERDFALKSPWIFGHSPSDSSRSTRVSWKVGTR